MTFQSMLIYPLSCELIGGIGPWWAKQRSPWIPDSHFLAIVITTSPPPLTGLGEWAIPHSCALRGRNLDTHTHTYTHIPICHPDPTSENPYLCHFIFHPELTPRATGTQQKICPVMFCQGHISVNAVVNSRKPSGRPCMKCEYMCTRLFLCEDTVTRNRNEGGTRLYPRK